MDSQEYTDISRIHNAFLTKSSAGKYKKRGRQTPSSAFPHRVLLSLNTQDLTAIVGTASLARSVGHDGFTALGAGDETGCANFPVGTTSLVASCLGNFTFRNSHDDTSLVQMPDGT